MTIKEILEQLNFIHQCRKYSLSLWQCPAFLTIIMGVVTIIAMLGTYFIANYYAQEPEMTALVVIITTLIIFIIGYFIVNSFNYLAEANQMKSEFVSITTHQLRTPLSSSKWSLNLLLDDRLCQLNEREKEYFDIIKISTERMIKLVNDLLDVSRIEQNRLDLRPEKFSLINLLKSLTKELKPLAQAQNILLELTNDENLPMVFADASRIRLVAQNLIDNAIKYTDEGGKVKIKIFPQNNYLKIEVQDSGVGIPENQQKQIFQKFFRSDNMKKLQVEGTGLGLFIAKAIAEASGGKIGFESKEGRGSTFWFTLPAVNK